MLDIPSVKYYKINVSVTSIARSQRSHKLKILETYFMFRGYLNYLTESYFAKINNKKEYI